MSAGSYLEMSPWQTFFLVPHSELAGKITVALPQWLLCFESPSLKWPWQQSYLLLANLRNISPGPTFSMTGW